MAIESFVSRAQRLDRQGHCDEAWDLIYDSFDEALQQGRFQELDQVLAHIGSKDLSMDILLGILTATLAVRTKLPSRAALYQKIQDMLGHQGKYEPGLLAGLAG